MGVTVFYKGKLKSPDLLNSAIDELQSLAEELKWEYQLFSDDDPFISGIILSPHSNAESLNFLFNSEGRMVNLISVGFKLKEFPPGEFKFSDDCYLCWCKTQFAGPLVHKMVVELLDYVKKKYCAKMEIKDDGGYYPDRNEAELLRRMSFIDSMIDALAYILETGEPPENLPEDQKKNIKEIYRQLQLLLNHTRDNKISRN